MPCLRIYLNPIETIAFYVYTVNNKHYFLDQGVRRRVKEL